MLRPRRSPLHLRGGILTRGLLSSSSSTVDDLTSQLDASLASHLTQFSEQDGSFSAHWGTHFLTSALAEALKPILDTLDGDNGIVDTDISTILQGLNPSQLKDLLDRTVTEGFPFPQDVDLLPALPSSFSSKPTPIDFSNGATTTPALPSFDAFPPLPL